jgi:hypothetical protein
MRSFVPRLLEFFMGEAPVDDEGQPLRSQDPFAPPVQHKAVGSNPGGIRATPKQSDKTMDALTQPGAQKVGQAGYRPSSSAPRGPQGNQNGQGGGSTQQLAKPNYRGSYVGQTQTTNGQHTYKNVSWQKKGSDERGFGKVPSMQKATVVWDGNDWISQDEFDRKARLGQLKKK